jgi:hypothetical protein
MLPMQSLRPSPRDDAVGRFNDLGGSVRMGNPTTLDGRRIFEAGPSAFQGDFNRVPFSFSHRLGDHPLFDLDRLTRLAQTLMEDKDARNVRWQTSEAAVENGWDVPVRTRHDELTEAIANLDRSGSWVLLYSVQRDPEYMALLDLILAELDEVAGCSLAEEITWKDAYVFMASPHAVTPYHIDHESTFLFQIHGQRVANLWDPGDRSVLTDREIENYYSGNLGAANYKEEYQGKAHVYAMPSGVGVHHPVRAPHWFKNGDSYSVALGVHFCLRDYDRQARVYQINHLLRLAGLRPVPPGQSRWRDQAKIHALGVFSKRHPQTKFELLRSGIMRATSPLRAARNLKRKFLPGRRRDDRVT